MSDISAVVRESRDRDVDALLQEKISEVSAEGYEVEFGNIGKHTTYALLVNKVTGQELVGYTFIQNMHYYRENVGKLKALQQALARKKISETK